MMNDEVVCIRGGVPHHDFSSEAKVLCLPPTEMSKNLLTNTFDSLDNKQHLISTIEGLVPIPMD